jgi:hypothetical protein
MAEGTYLAAVRGVGHVVGVHMTADKPVHVRFETGEIHR